MDVGRVAKEDDRRPPQLYGSRAQSHDDDECSREPTDRLDVAGTCLNLSKPLDSSSSIVIVGGQYNYHKYCCRIVSATALVLTDTMLCLDTHADEAEEPRGPLPSLLGRPT